MTRIRRQEALISPSSKGFVVVEILLLEQPLAEVEVLSDVRLDRNDATYLMPPSSHLIEEPEQGAYGNMFALHIKSAQACRVAICNF